jgi:hypothetical protein
VPIPPVVATDLIVVQPRFAFGFLEALLDRPARAGHTGQRTQRRLGWSVNQVVSSLSRVADRAADQQPALAGQPAIPLAARGSATASVVVWALGLSGPLPA